MKLCIIGVRGHYGYVLDGLSALPEVALVGISTGADGDDIAPLKSWCEANGQPGRVFEDWREMLDAISPDIVAVAGPFERTAEMCIEALGRGMHVFCEKPVAMTLAELDEVAAAYAAARATSGAGLAAMMGMRYDPAFHAAWRAVAGGAIGEVRIISARKSYKLGRRAEFYHSRATYPGTIPWVGSHAIDWVRWFTGKEFRTVFATHSAAHNRDHGELETAAMCQFTLADGVQASVSIDYLRPDSAPTHGDDRIRLAGTDGVIEVRDGEAFLINGQADGEQRLPAECDRQIFVDFVGSVTGAGECLISPADTLAVTEACLLARQSADEGRVVTFGDNLNQGGN